MKSFLLSLILILCCGFTPQSFDQLDQPSKIVKDLKVHFEIGFISAGQEFTVKVKPPTYPLILSSVKPSNQNARHAVIASASEIKVSHHSNYISSGASLIFELNRIRV